MNIADMAVQLITSPAQLQQVVQNLIGNVLKHGVDYFDVKVNSEAVITFTGKIAHVEGARS